MKKKFSFGIKLNFKEKKIDPDLNHIELLHNTDGHNKYYIIKFSQIKGINHEFPFIVTITFGKVGNNGNQTLHKFTERHLANDFMNQKLKEKLKKGYKRMV